MKVRNKKEIGLFIRFLKEKKKIKSFKFLYNHQRLGVQYKKYRYMDWFTSSDLSNASILEFCQSNYARHYFINAFSWADGSMWDFLNKEWLQILNK